MRNIAKIVLVTLAMLPCTEKLNAQGMIVIMNQRYTCEDPRGFDENSEWTFNKGDALHVYKRDNSYDYYGPYTAACVSIPARFCHIPGTVKGEKYIVVNGTNVRLRQGPSTSSGIYCFDSDYGGSIAQEKFIVNPSKELSTYGNSYSWKPFYFNKGTRLPYLGKVNGFYKTKFDGVIFYISAKYCILK